MSGNQRLNGSDYLMLGFDHELRRCGYAGNSCQIILELGSGISRDLLENRLNELCRRWPVLQARPGGVFLPRWRVPPPRELMATPSIHVHRSEAGLEHRLCNQPLAIESGELLRFDLIESQGSGARVLFTWAHALMDAPSAEYVLTLIGRQDLTFPIGQNATKPDQTSLSFAARLKLAWKTLYRIDRMCGAAPQSLGTRKTEAPKTLAYRVEKFSADESQRIRDNAVRLCGPLGAAQFHAAAAMVELDRLHARLARPSPSYVLPLPVGLRPKGAIEPIFSNQVIMLMTQFLPEDLQSVEKAVALLKREMHEALRSNLLESGRILSELFRFLPLPIYMGVLKKGLGGEICSLFYGDTAAVNPHLTNFLGAPILDFVHVAAITPSPGLGVIFYYFQRNLRVTILHLLPVLSNEEAAEFASKLRTRLLEPS
jgi:hypothetical protein